MPLKKTLSSFVIFGNFTEVQAQTGRGEEVYYLQYEMKLLKDPLATSNPVFLPSRLHTREPD